MNDHEDDYDADGFDPVESFPWEDFGGEGGRGGEETSNSKGRTESSPSSSFPPIATATTAATSPEMTMTTTAFTTASNSTNSKIAILPTAVPSTFGTTMAGSSINWANDSFPFDMNQAMDSVGFPSSDTDGFVVSDFGKKEITTTTTMTSTNPNTMVQSYPPEQLFPSEHVFETNGDNTMNRNDKHASDDADDDDNDKEREGDDQQEEDVPVEEEGTGSKHSGRGSISTSSRNRPTRTSGTTDRKENRKLSSGSQGSRRSRTTNTGTMISATDENFGAKIRLQSPAPPSPSVFSDGFVAAFGNTTNIDMTINTAATTNVPTISSSVVASSSSTATSISIHDEREKTSSHHRRAGRSNGKKSESDPRGRSLSASGHGRRRQRVSSIQKSPYNTEALVSLDDLVSPNGMRTAVLSKANVPTIKSNQNEKSNSNHKERTLPPVDDIPSSPRLRRQTFMNRSNRNERSIPVDDFASPRIPRRASIQNSTNNFNNDNDRRPSFDKMRSSDDLTSSRLRRRTERQGSLKNFNHREKTSSTADASPSTTNNSSSQVEALISPRASVRKRSGSVSKRRSERKGGSMQNSTDKEKSLNQMDAPHRTSRISRLRETSGATELTTPRPLDRKGSISRSSNNSLRRVGPERTLRRSGSDQSLQKLESLGDRNRGLQRTLSDNSMQVSSSLLQSQVSETTPPASPTKDRSSRLLSSRARRSSLNVTSSAAGRQRARRSTVEKMNVTNDRPRGSNRRSSRAITSKEAIATQDSPSSNRKSTNLEVEVVKNGSASLRPRQGEPAAPSSEIAPGDCTDSPKKTYSDRIFEETLKKRAASKIMQTPIRESRIADLSFLKKSDVQPENDGMEEEKEPNSPKLLANMKTATLVMKFASKLLDKSKKVLNKVKDDGDERDGNDQPAQQLERIPGLNAAPVTTTTTVVSNTALLG